MPGAHWPPSHTALAAGIFTALVPRLRDADVRTLGEAEAFAARRTDMIRREVEAGWYSMPGEAPDAPSLPPLARVDSFLYLRRLDDVMNSPAQSIRPQGTLREAARIMIEQRIGALLVIGGEPRPAGIVTERDLLRATTDPRIDLDVTSDPQGAAFFDRAVRYRAHPLFDRLTKLQADDRSTEIGILAAWRRFAAPSPHCSPVIDRGRRST